MNNDTLIKRVKAHGSDLEAVEAMLIELMTSGDVTPEQVLQCLDDPKGEWPGGYPYDGKDGMIGCDPTFAVSVTTEYERLSGNENAFCC